MSDFAHSEIRTQCAPCDLLFVHGNLASKHWWYPGLEVIQSLWNTETLTKSVVLGEIRGHGRSILPPGELKIDDIVNDFIAMSEKARLQNAVVVGHSAGGLISALLLSRRPDLFKGGILIDPVGPQGLLNVPVDIEARYQMMIGNRALASQIIGATIYNNKSDNTFFNDVIMDDCMTTLDHCGVQLVKTLTGIDYSDEISRVRQPVRIFYGQHDWVLPVQNATDYTRLIKNSEIIFLPDNGHCMNFESPERLATEVIDFLKKDF